MDIMNVLGFTFKISNKNYNKYVSWFIGLSTYYRMKGTLIKLTHSSKRHRKIAVFNEILSKTVHFGFHHNTISFFYIISFHKLDNERCLTNALKFSVFKIIRSVLNPATWNNLWTELDKFPFHPVFTFQRHNYVYSYLLYNE